LNLKHNTKNLLAKYSLLDEAKVVKQVLILLWHKILHFDIDSRAAAVAFNFTLAVFPTIIFLFTLIPYIPIHHLDLQIMDFMENIMPKGIFLEARSTILDIISKKRGNVLSLGFIFALYASTSGMMALMRTFNLTYRTAENRGFLKQRLVALTLNFLLTFILFIAIVILIVGRQLIDISIDEGWLTEDINLFVLNIIRYVVVFAVLFVAVSIIYFVAPSIHKRWTFFNYGSITASILIILSTNLFSYYLSNFATYNRLYGSIGTIIALMLWLYLIALILIVGFEINVSLDHAKAGKLPDIE
jgi:membrane protein